ncbi:MAG: hypothetical protein EXR98_18070 [Gemmataceae bacterium]|nr:hypothetical protein [Gemmataceae bacterium]
MLRKLWLAGMCGIVGLMLMYSQAPIEAQGKKDELAKQVQQLKKALAESHQHFNKLKADFDFYKKKHAVSLRVQKDLDAAHQTIRDRDATIVVLQNKSPTAVADLTKENSALRKRVRELTAIQKAPFIHTAILRLKKADDAQVKRVYDEVAKTIAKIDGVRNVYLGKPAENGTPELAQKGYQLGVVVLLDDADALQKYLDDPLLKQFKDKMSDYWERPLIYDFQRDMDEAKKDAK